MNIDRNLIERCITEYNNHDKDKEEKLEKKIRKEILNKVFNELHLTEDRDYKGILVDIINWKAPRVGKRSESDEKFIGEITRFSRSTHNERVKIEILCLLKGVSFRVASAILHFYFPDKYIIMDWRAWSSLKHFGLMDSEFKNNFKSWEKYLSVCISLKEKFSNKFTLRDIDKALWAYSKYILKEKGV